MDSKITSVTHKTEFLLMQCLEKKIQYSINLVAFYFRIESLKAIVNRSKYSFETKPITVGEFF